MRFLNRTLFALLALAASSQAFARLGESFALAEKRYGPGMKVEALRESFPNMEVRKFVVGPYVVLCFYPLEVKYDRCIRIIYSRNDGGGFHEGEVLALAEKNALHFDLAERLRQSLLSTHAFLDDNTVRDHGSFFYKGSSHGATIVEFASKEWYDRIDKYEHLRKQYGADFRRL